MKAILLPLLFLVSMSAFAIQEGQSTMSAPTAATVSTEKANLTEAGFHYSSINDGSAFATVGLIHEFANGFALGMRGFLPMQYTKQSQAYMGQLVSRFILLNENDQMYIEGTMAQGFFNGTYSGMPFVTIGADYGYSHKINNQIALGGSLGIDYSNQRITQDDMTNRRTLYSKFSLNGSYYF